LKKMGEAARSLAKPSAAYDIVNEIKSLKK
jgi:hypothetical protein